MIVRQFYFDASDPCDDSPRVRERRGVRVIKRYPRGVERLAPVVGLRPVAHVLVHVARLAVEHEDGGRARAEPRGGRGRDEYQVERRRAGPPRVLVHEGRGEVEQLSAIAERARVLKRRTHPARPAVEAGDYLAVVFEGRGRRLWTHTLLRERRRSQKCEQKRDEEQSGT